MATIAGINLSTPRMMAKMTESPKAQPMAMKSPWLNNAWKRPSQFRYGRMSMKPPRAAPDSISEKVEKSIKEAQEACQGDPASSECVAAWDEVEELSAAASHARDKQKASDPLETYCKDNPGTDECRTYED